MTMVTRDDILEVLATIPDPEMPISIVDLGLVEAIGIEGDAVRVTLLPTFVGCPALDMIRGDVEAKLGAMPGVGGVDVAFVYEPPWTVDRITEAGRESLREHGVTVPDEGGRLAVAGHAEQVQLRTSAVACPFCGSDSTYLDSPFGPTRCRTIYYCNSCRNSFERMKRL